MIRVGRLSGSRWYFRPTSLAGHDACGVRPVFKYVGATCRPTSSVVRPNMRRGSNWVNSNGRASSKACRFRPERQDAARPPPPRQTNTTLREGMVTAFADSVFSSILNNKLYFVLFCNLQCSRAIFCPRPPRAYSKP